MRVWLFATLMVLEMSCQLRAQAQPDLDRPARLSHSAPVATLQGFVANQGQWPSEVRFFASHGRIDATVLDDALVFRQQPEPETGAWPTPVVLRLPHATLVEGEFALPTAHHFILGSGTTSWVPGFARVVFRDVAPGIELVLRKDGQGFAYDLHLAPGASLDDLVLELEGVEGLTVKDGDVLAMQTDSCCVEQRIGESWQIDPASGAKSPVASQFRVLNGPEGRLRFGFEAPGRDSGRPFILDPSLVWATYVGGTSQELLQDLHVTADGSVYLAVKSFSAGPTTPGVFQPSNPGGSNAWIGKLSPDGSALEWGTFLGGSAAENVVGIEVDQDGTVVVVGDSFSRDFPTTPASLQPTFGGGNNDIFASRLVANGSSLAWSTFYGGSDFELADSSVLFASGDLLIAGHPNPVSGDPPAATSGAYDTVFDSDDQMVVRLSADGTQVVFQTYFASGRIHLTLDAASNIYMSGSAGDDFPATPGALKESKPPGSASDGFVVKMNPLGSQLVWATYLGGDSLSETIPGIAVDSAGAVYVAGLTTSTDFPVTSGAFDVSSSNDGGDGFVAKLLPGGTGLVWSTYISACCGGASQMFDVVVDAAGNAVAVGSSNEPNFPTTPDAFQPAYVSAGDAHLTKFDAFGETLVYSTYLGGSSAESVPVVGLDGSQDPIIGLRSSSGDFPVSSGVYDTTYAGITDTVVAKIDLTLLPWLVLGGGLPGAIDTPNLAGTGALTPGSPARLSVKGAATFAPATLIAGLSAANLAFKGGLMVPFPAVIVTLSTNSQGELDLPFTWVNVPAGIPLWVQVWIKDTGAPTSFSATNALRMTSQ